MRHDQVAIGDDTYETTILPAYMSCKGEAVKNHSRVIEDVRGKPVHFAFRLERGTEPVGEENRCYSAHALLDHREEKGRCW
ncbi:hypothetical protein HO173_010671 [Letharia columbiana]|uniref:Uncharacterized protein n=1 Tax=Letharia columbiana TaxID=112416 RepID=A0A8H6FMB8_9LECA|nr:uncharacterized protein HO173_010671 [Letharia columbiana]KAF6231171.1 hypothetical protein HO173_010671 [Letharia columbiana]